MAYLKKMDKGFLSSLPNLFNQFIGVFENSFFVAADTYDQLRIYKKDIINIGDWKLVWSKSVTLLPPKQCTDQCHGRISVYGLSTNSILIFYGSGTHSNPSFKLIQLNLSTLNETEIKCNFSDTDFFIEHLSEICNRCQNSKLQKSQASNLIILTHFNEYLTTMAFEIDFKNCEIGHQNIKFNNLPDEFIVEEGNDNNEDDERMISNVSINSEGIVAVIYDKKMFCAEFKSADEYIETWYDLDDLSDLPQLDNHSRIYLYSDETTNNFKCFVWYLNGTHECFNIVFSSEPNIFTLLNEEHNSPFDLREPLRYYEILVTNDYIFFIFFNELYTFVTRMLSLSEMSYLAFLKVKTISVENLKKQIQFPSFLPLTQPPKIFEENENGF